MTSSPMNHFDALHEASSDATTPPHNDSSFAGLIPMRWLKMATLMLLLSGVFSLIIVFARTPGLYNIPYVKKLFHESLVIHVDLLVLAWPLCIAGMMWALFCPSKLGKAGATTVNIFASWLIGVGALGLVVSPLDFAAEPLKNNYIPVITSDIFMLGLRLIGMGAVLLAMHALFFNRRHSISDVSLAATSNWAGRGAAIIVLFSLLALYLGFERTSAEGIDAERYYESAIWAGGHIYQYAFTQIQMLAWLWLAYHLSDRLPAKLTIVRALFLLNAAVGSLGIIGILQFDTLSFEYNRFYTLHMIIGGGIAPTLMLLWLGYTCLLKRKAVNADTSPASGEESRRYLLPALLASIALFLYGGILGLLIQGQDVTIPAHYHGSTISITIALMGFAFCYVSSHRQLTPRLKKLMRWQPIIYAAGQFMHITGLAVSGGYGVLRKTPGLEDGFSKAKIAMGFMGMGGLLAMAGGLVFVYIMWRCLKKQ